MDSAYSLPEIRLPLAERDDESSSAYSADGAGGLEAPTQPLEERMLSPSPRRTSTASAVSEVPDSPSSSASKRRQYLPPALTTLFSNNPWFGGNAADQRPPTTSHSPTVRAQVIDLSDTRSFSRSSSRDRPADISVIGDAMVSEVRQLLFSVNVFKSNISPWSRLYCVLTIVSGLLVFVMSSYILSASVTSSFERTVTDGTVCQQFSYVEVKVGNIAYHVVALYVTSLFVVWYSARAVTLEKTGLLICVVVAGLYQIARLVYFSFGDVLAQYFSERVVLAARVTYCIAGTLLVFSMLISFLVTKSFGWRAYAKGVTQVDQLERLRRMMQFDTATKLDYFVTIISVVTMYFLVDSTALQIIGFVFTAATVLALQTVKAVIKRRLTAVLYLFAVISLAMPVIYVYAAISVVAQSDLLCVQENLQCLATIHVEVVNASFPTSGNWTLLPTHVSDMQFLVDGCDAVCFHLQNSTILGGIDTCCTAYGHCRDHNDLQVGSGVMVAIQSLTGLIARCVTMYLAYKQRKEMNLPSVRELLDRVERNLRNVSESVQKKVGGR